MGFSPGCLPGRACTWSRVCSWRGVCDSVAWSGSRCCQRVRGSCPNPASPFCPVLLSLGLTASLMQRVCCTSRPALPELTACLVQFCSPQVLSFSVQVLKFKWALPSQQMFLLSIPPSLRHHPQFFWARMGPGSRLSSSLWWETGARCGISAWEASLSAWSCLLALCLGEPPLQVTSGWWWAKRLQMSSSSPPTPPPCPHPASCTAGRVVGQWEAKTENPARTEWRRDLGGFFR